MNKVFKLSWMYFWFWQLSDRLHKSTRSLINHQQQHPACITTAHAWNPIFYYYSQTMTYCMFIEAMSTRVWHVMLLEWVSEVNCPWNSIVNLCCFNGCIFYSRSVDTEKQITSAHYIYTAQTQSSLWNKQNAYAFPAKPAHIFYRQRH